MDALTLPDEAVAAYRRGWTPITIKANGRAPADSRWQKMSYPNEDAVRRQFAAAHGMGLVLGPASGGLVDIDIDDPTTRTVANLLQVLPRTPVESGHRMAPRSHRWYTVTGGMPTVTKLKGHEGPGDVLVEIRGHGGQTVIPPTERTDQGALVWEPVDGMDRPERISELPDPAVVPFDNLVRDVHMLAVLGYIKRIWPTASGGRHACHLALAGGLLMTRAQKTHPMWVQHGEGFLHTVARLLRDEEAYTRPANLTSTVQAIEAGRPVQGWPTLAEYVGDDEVAALKSLIFSLEKVSGYEDVRGTTEWNDVKAIHINQIENAPVTREDFQERLREAQLSESHSPEADHHEDPDDRDDDDDDGVVLYDTLAEKYPHAPEHLRKLLAAVDGTLEIPETPWGMGVAGDVQPESLSSEPELMLRTDGVPLLSKGTLNLLFGSPKSGKSWVSVAAVADIVRSGGTAMYIDWENGHPELYDRFWRIGLTSEERSRIKMFFPGSHRLGSVGDRFAPGEPNINDLTLAIALLEIRPDLIVVDALTGLLGRHGMSPNDASGVERVETLLKDTMTSTGAAVLLVDHRGHEAGERAAGSFRKQAMITGAILSVEGDEKMGRDTHGWSHLRLIDERNGWLMRHSDDKGDIATIDVDDTPSDTAEGRPVTLLTLKPPVGRDGVTVPMPPGVNNTPTAPAGQISDESLRARIVDALETNGPLPSDRLIGYVYKAAGNVTRMRVQSEVKSLLNLEALTVVDVDGDRRVALLEDGDTDG